MLHLCWPPLLLSLVSCTFLLCAPISSQLGRLQSTFWSKSWSCGTRHVLLKQNKHEPFLGTRQVQHLLLSSIQCHYSQTVVVALTVTAQLPLLGCLPLLLLSAQNGLVFIQTEASNLKYNQLIDAFQCIF